MKKLLSILLVLILLFNIGGFYVVIKSRQYAIRKEVKRQIKHGVDEKDLVPILVNDDNQDQLDWKHSKEFRYKGSMYDIVRTEFNENGTITYHCIIDDNESALFNDLDRLVQVKQKHTHKNIFQIQKSLTLFAYNIKLLEDVFATPENAQINIAYVEPYVSKVYLDIPCPPPN